MEIHPCVLQDIGPLRPLPKKESDNKDCEDRIRKNKIRTAEKRKRYCKTKTSRERELDNKDCEDWEKRNQITRTQRIE